MSETEIRKEKEKEIELECSSCKEPKTLKCLKSFCLECLETHSNSNVSQLSNLPIEIGKNQSSQIQNDPSPQKKQKIMCSDEENVAISCCLDCEEYYCEMCTKAHRTMKISKNHKVIPIEEMKEDSTEISPEKCLILRNENQIINARKGFQFKIISYSIEGKELKIGGNGDKFKIQIEGESMNEDNEKKKWTIADLNNGGYIVRMVIMDEGKYSIAVKCNEIDIVSSPFQIQVFPGQRKYSQITEPKFTFGSSGGNRGEFYNPSAITMNSKGEIIVCDTENHRIQIFNSEGKPIFEIGEKGERYGEFMRPCGVAVNSQGNIIVCDTENHRIQIFNSNGKFLKTFEGGEDGQFQNPHGVCVDKKDNIYVCDTENARIQIFNYKGKFISSFDCQFSNDDIYFECPNWIALNSKGNFVVSDTDNNAVVVFDSQGKFISACGLRHGTKNREMMNPHGVCVDINDNILVCDQMNSRIQVFTPSGKYTHFKTDWPTGIMIDPKTQNIIVCGGNQKVSIF